MNQTFSFHRFSLLLKKHWADNKKRYFLAIAAFMGLLLCWFVFVMLTDSYDPMAKGLQQVSYYFPLFLIGGFYASQFFSDLSSRPKGINFLMVPASILEKFLCSLLYTLVFFFVVYTAAFYLVDALMVLAANAAHPGYNEIVNGVAPAKASIANVFTSDEFGTNGNIAWYIFLVLIGVQSFYLLGSVYFEKYSFIKTSIAGFLIALFFFLLIYFFNEVFMPDGGYHNGISGYRIDRQNGESLLVQLPEWIGKALQYLFMYALPPLFWAATYFRLKEKQV